MKKKRVMVFLRVCSVGMLLFHLSKKGRFLAMDMQCTNQAALNKKYQEKGYVFPLKESYNAHNLWLQSWLENGILA